MPQSLKNFLHSLFILYICVCLVGCASRTVLNYAEQSGDVEKHNWQIEDVTFAAISDNRYVRMCVEFSDKADSSRTAEFEIRIDLKTITERLNTQDSTVNKFNDGWLMESTTCAYGVEENERMLAIRISYSDVPDVSKAIQALAEEPDDRPVIKLLHHTSGNYLAFGAPSDMFTGIDQHALDTYTKGEKKSNLLIIFALLPVAFAFDVAIFGVVVVLSISCLVLPPLCIPAKIMAEGIIGAQEKSSSDEGGYEVESDDW